MKNTINTLHNAQILVKKNNYYFLLLFASSLLVQVFLPWWSLAVMAFIVSFWTAPSATKAFGYATTINATIWLFIASFLHVTSGGSLTAKMAELLLKSPTNTAYLFAITAFVAGLVGGVAAWAGYCCKDALRR